MAHLRLSAIILLICIANATQLVLEEEAKVAEIVQLYSQENQQSTKNCICTGTSTDYQECYFSFTCDSLSNNTNDGIHCTNCPGASHNSPINSSPLKILLYNNVNDDISIFKNSMTSKCSVKCEFHTRATTPINEYDALLFSIIKWDMNFPSKPTNQKWIAHCAESVQSYYSRHLRDPNYMSHFDIQSTYLKTKQAQTFPPTNGKPFNLHVNYLNFEYGSLNEYSTPASFAMKTQSAPVVWIQSNCQTVNNRLQYVQELMNYIRIDSYGACLRNKEFPFEDSRHQEGWGKRKLDIISQYKFVLSFENSNTEDYVTEKLYHAYLAKAVPVYMGAPNVDEFVPGNHSLIKVSDFASAMQLADYLNLLSTDETLYNSYHQWRTLGVSNQFKKMIHYTYHSLPCRVCETVYALKNNSTTLDIMDSPH